MTIGQWQEEGEILFSHFIYHVEGFFSSPFSLLLHHNLATLPSKVFLGGIIITIPSYNPQKNTEEKEGFLIRLARF